MKLQRVEIPKMLRFPALNVLLSQRRSENFDSLATSHSEFELCLPVWDRLTRVAFTTIYPLVVVLSVIQRWRLESDLIRSCMSKVWNQLGLVLNDSEWVWDLIIYPMRRDRNCDSLKVRWIQTFEKATNTDRCSFLFTLYYSKSVRIERTQFSTLLLWVRLTRSVACKK